VYSYTPSNYSIEDAGAKSVLIRTMGNVKMQVIVMLLELADSMEPSPYMTINQKTLPKVQLLKVLIIICQKNGTAA
jgi:hypothetical protein